MRLQLHNFALDLSKRPHVMGILNVTPDSFWDGGRYEHPDHAIARANRMADCGADIIDVGGESTRPGSEPVSQGLEIERMRPVVEALVRDARVPVSVDTRRAGVAREMLNLGAHMINDTSGLTFDENMSGVVREYDVPVVIMHMRGTPETMQDLTDYEDVVADVKCELLDRVRHAEQAGIRPDHIVIDPGIGFAKTATQCAELIARLDELVEIGKPILLGPSRKSFIGKAIGLEPEDRLEATIASCIVGVNKGASIVRVHDVANVSRALKMLEYLKHYERKDTERVLP